MSAVLSSAGLKHAHEAVSLLRLEGDILQQGIHV
jgi:hypothetical protein